MKEKPAKASYDVPAVRHAIGLLELLSESIAPLGVTEISKQMRLNKNMVFRLLNTLAREGWIRQEDEGPKYAMSLRPFQITAKPVGRWSVSQAAFEPLQKLWQQMGESFWHGVLHDGAALYIQHFDSTQNVRVAGMVGGRYPLHCTAPGKMLLAHADDRIFDQLCEKELERFTPNTLTDRLKLRRHLQEIRSQGYAVDNEEYGKGILCLAVPIFDHRSTMISTIGVSVSTLSYDKSQMLDKFLPLLQTIGNEISRHMGFPGFENGQKR